MARWSIVKAFTPPVGRSTWVSHTGQRIPICCCCCCCCGRPRGFKSWHRDPSEAESKSLFRKSRTEKGSSSSRHWVQMVCKQGKRLGALKSPMQGGQWVLATISPSGIWLGSLPRKASRGFFCSDMLSLLDRTIAVGHWVHPKETWAAPEKTPKTMQRTEEMEKTPGQS